MDITLILAQSLGIIFAVIGISVVVNKKGVAAAIEELIRNRGFLWLFGFIITTVGAVIIALNNVWNSELQLLIAIMGWLSLIKGASILLFPDLSVSLYRKFNKDNILVFGGFVAFILGLLLIYKSLF